MTLRRRRFIAACGSLAVARALPVGAASPTRELHGVADAFAAPGVTLAWGILRGTSEATTTVVLRIVADPVEFPAVSATGTDPFTQKTIPLLAATPTTQSVDLRLPRNHFADYPRTDLHFYAAATPASAEAPRLVVYYLGVPDTTPELATEAALDASLADRLARARSNPGGKPP
jgi:hypothetical protein